MDTLLQQFETPFAGRDGEMYVAFLYGRSRPADTWQGWIVFERMRDGRRFATPVETTQSSAEAVLYWGTGLTDAYFDGALDRALRPAAPEPARSVEPSAVIGHGVDHDSRRARLTHVESDIIRHFATHRMLRVLVRSLFAEVPHAHADIVRALEDLEKSGRMLVRRTEEGNDWVFLTEEGVRAAGLQDVPRRDENVRP